MDTLYCESLTKFSRRKTISVNVGRVKIGGDNSFCLQTMTNTLTSEIDSTAKQVISAYLAGAQIVRITVPSMRDVDFLHQIKKQVVEQGYDIPIVADIHFNQKIAFEAAKVVEKVRINPGNFADSKKQEHIDYTELEYNAELNRIEREFIPLLDICKKNNSALRIGTNHGSLSDRIMSRFGDTPEGMAESAMEFLRICKSQNFSQVVISMKASNTMVMVQATRLLVAKMKNESMLYPLHLGVTEAGEGEDGRIKSAVGIGALLADGIGDTIRVSLTEPPEYEIPVAQKLAAYFNNRQNHVPIAEIENIPINPYRFERRKTNAVLTVGGNFQPVVIADFSTDRNTFDLQPDFFFKHDRIITTDISEKIYPLQNKLELTRNAEVGFIEFFADEIDTLIINKLKELVTHILVIKTRNINGFADQRAAVIRLINANIKLPVILKRDYKEDDLETFQLKSAADLGGLFLDGLADGIWITNTGKIKDSDIVSTAFGILQASRMRMSKPEYISCPSCGRTMFNLQEVTKSIRDKTSHLKGLKIGIMGCIVNGLGEMADADYGYIGSGKGKVNLYHKKELIKKGVSENDAVGELIQLIKTNGDWVEPETK